MRGVISFGNNKTLRLMRLTTAHYPWLLAQGWTYTRNANAFVPSGFNMSIRICSWWWFAAKWLNNVCACERERARFAEPFRCIFKILSHFFPYWPIDEYAGKRPLLVPTDLWKLCKGVLANHSSSAAQQGQFRRPTDALTAFCYAMFLIIISELHFKEKCTNPDLLHEEYLTIMIKAHTLNVSRNVQDILLLKHYRMLHWNVKTNGTAHQLRH